MTRLFCLSLLWIHVGFLRLNAESEWRPWVEKINGRLVETLTPPQRSALAQPPVRVTEGKSPRLETQGRQVLVSEDALELWSRLAVAIGRDSDCPGYLAEFLRRCADAPNGVAALPDPAEIPTKKARKPVTDDRNQQLTAFNQLAATLVATELIRTSLVQPGVDSASIGSTPVATSLSDAQALEALREGTRLAARSGYTSEALQSLVKALPTGAAAPEWASAFLPPQTRGPALAKEIKKVERKALGR